MSGRIIPIIGGWPMDTQQNRIVYVRLYGEAFRRVRLPKPPPGCIHAAECRTCGATAALGPKGYQIHVTDGVPVICLVCLDRNPEVRAEGVEYRDTEDWPG